MALNLFNFQTRSLAPLRGNMAPQGIWAALAGAAVLGVLAARSDAQPDTLNDATRADEAGDQQVIQVGND